MTDLPTASDSASPQAGQAAAPRRWLILLEVAAVVLLVLVQLWSPWRFWGYRPFKPLELYLLPALVVIIVVVSVLRLRDTPADLGLTPAQWRRGWGSVIAFTLLNLALLVVAGWMWGWPAMDAERWMWLAGYAPVLVGQQLALQCFLNNRLFASAAGWKPRRRLWYTVVAATIVFVLLHAPNLPLMAMVAWAGGFWTWHFRRHRNLPALIASHLILGVAAMALLGDGPLLRLRVGRGAWKLLMADG